MRKEGFWLAALKSIFKLKSKDSGKGKAFAFHFEDKTPNALATNSKTRTRKGKGRWNCAESSDVLVTSSLETRLPADNGEPKENHALLVAAASVAAAEAAAVAAYAAVEVVRLTGISSPTLMRASQEQHIGDSRFSTALSLSREDWAAIKIQTAFRAYLARKAFRALRGLVRLQAIFRGHIVRRKASRTFQCMQALLRVQTRIREMRMKAYENGGGVARSNLLQQHKQESSNEQKENLGDRNSLGYNSTVQSAEELQSTRTKKTDLTRLKREKLWAYALSRQPRDCPAKESSDFHAEHYSDKFHSGWTWLKHWMSATSWQDARLDSRLAELIVKDSKLDRPTAESRIEGDGVKKSDTLEGKFGETFDKSIVICPLQRQSLAMSNCRRVKTSSNSESRNTPSTRSLYRKCHTSPKNGRTRHHSLLDDEASLRSPDTPNYMSTTQSAFSKRSSRSLSLPKQKPFTSGREFNALSSARRRLSFSTTKGSLGSSKHTSKLP